MSVNAPEAHLRCPRCRTELPKDSLNGREVACSCGAVLEVTVFPALHQSVQRGRVGEEVVLEGESECFYHPRKRAIIPCSICGRFLCALCDLDLNGQHICPVCLSSNQRKGRLPEIENERVLYDNIALGTAIVPMIMVPITLLTAPVSVVMAIWWWRKPNSLIPRSRIRYLFAITIGLLQMIGWLALFVLLPKT